MARQVKKVAKTIAERGLGKEEEGRKKGRGRREMREMRERRRRKKMEGGEEDRDRKSFEQRPYSIELNHPSPTSIKVRDGLAIRSQA